MEIANADTPVHRLLQTAWVQDDVVSPQSLIPRPKDKLRLSLLNRGDTAAESLGRWRAAFPGTNVTRCLTLTVGHFSAVGVPVHDTPTSRFPSHVSAVFVGKSDDEIEVIAAQLVERGELGPA